MSNHSFSSGKPGTVSLMEAGPVVEIHASHQSNHQHKDPYGRDGYSGPTILPRQAIYTPPEFQFVLQDHNYWAPYPSTPPPRSPKRERLLNDHSYDEDWTKALLNSNALPGGRSKAPPNTIPVPREPSRGRGASRGASRGKRGGSSSEGRKLPPLPNMKNSGTTKLVPQGKASYTRPTPPKVDLPSPRLPSPDIMSQSEIFARYKTPTPEPPPLQNGAFKDIQRLWDRKTSVSAPLPEPPPSMGLNDLDNDDDDNSSRTSSAPERDGDDTETAPEAENYSDAVTRCVCNFDHDDGYMICCDRCSVWQHVDCMGIGRNNIPEEYLCELCAPRRIDRARARALQQRKRIEFRLNSSASSSSESGDESDGETPKRKRSGSKTVKGTVRRPSKQRVKRTQKKQMKKKAEPKRGMLDVGRITNMRKRRKSQPSKAPEDLPPPEALATDSEKEKEAADLVTSLSDDGLSSPREDAQGKVPLWIERYEEAVTNHYSPELRARIATMRNTGQQQDFKGLPATIQQKCRVVLMTFNKKGLVCNVPCSANQALIEFRGKMMLSNQFQAKPTPKSGRSPPGTCNYVTYYNVTRDLEICVDSRTYGNDARYIQQSCAPNSEIRHVIEKGLLHLYVVSLRSLDKNEEITVCHDPKNPTPCSDHRCRYLSAKEPVTNNNTELAVERAERARRRRRQTATTDEEPEVPPVPSVAPARPKKEATPVKEPPPVAKPAPVVQSTPLTSAKRRRKNTEVESEEDVDEDKRKRRHTESDHSEGRKRTKSEVEQAPDSDKKLSREDRKMEAIMKAFERMEKLQAKSSHKPPATPQLNRQPKSESKDRDAISPPVGRPGRRGGRRGGRQRRLSGKKRFISGSDATSQEENEEDEEKSPSERNEFKYPANKKDELDIASHDVGVSQGSASVPSQYIRAAKSPARGGQSKRPSFSSILSIASAEGGSAKKRWLRQAISEEAEDGGSASATPGASGASTPVTESYGGNEPFDYQTPLKKRRFALSSMTGTPLTSPMSPEVSNSGLPTPNGKELSPASKALAFLDAIESIDMKQVQSVKKEIRFDIEEPNSTMPETFLEKDDSESAETKAVESKVENKTETKDEEAENVDVEGVEKESEKEEKVDDKCDYVDVEGVELNDEKQDIDDSMLGRVRLEKAITDENVDVENDLEETDGKGPTSPSSKKDELKEELEEVLEDSEVEKKTIPPSVQSESGLAEDGKAKETTAEERSDSEKEVPSTKSESDIEMQDIGNEPKLGTPAVSGTAIELMNNPESENEKTENTLEGDGGKLVEDEGPATPEISARSEVVSSEVDRTVEVDSAVVNNAKDVPDSGLEMPLQERELSMSPISEDATPPSSPAPLSEPRTPLQDEPDDPLSPRRNLSVKMLPAMDFSLPPSPPPPDFSFMKNVQEWEDTYGKKEGELLAATPEPPVLEKEVVEEQKPKKKLSISEYRRRKRTSVSEEGTPTADDGPPVLTLPVQPGEIVSEENRPIPAAVLEEEVAVSGDNGDEQPGSEAREKREGCQERTRRGFFLRVRDATPPASTSKPGKGPAPQPVPKGKWFTSTPRTQMIAPPPKAPVISVPSGAKINFPFPVRFNTPPTSEGAKTVTRGFHSPVTPMKLLKFPSLRPQNGVDSPRSVSKDKKGGKPS